MLYQNVGRLRQKNHFFGARKHAKQTNKYQKNEIEKEIEDCLKIFSQTSS